MEFTLPVSFLILIPFFVLILKQFIPKSGNLPPGPRPWPILGNILQLGKNPHISMTQFAKIHGPLICLRLGTQLVVIASSPDSAAEILKTQDRLLSARSVPRVAPYKLSVIDQHSIVWSSDLTNHWKSLRAFCRTHLFSAKAVESQADLREKKVFEMIEFLRSNKGKTVKISEILFATILNTLGNLFFTKNLCDLDSEGNTSGIKHVIRRFVELGAMPNISEFYPFLDALDLQGLRKLTNIYQDQLISIWAEVVKEKRQAISCGSSNKNQDFLDIMIDSGFSDLQINIILMELIAAGTDTTTSTIEWAMAELLRNKKVMHKLQAEIRSKIGSNANIRESNISELPYLAACVKETLRIHPPTPFLVPRRAPETCKLMNFTIPKNSRLFVNVWAIGRDSKTWEDALSFRPERFLDSSVDFRGQDFEFIPFGAGRRICPGLPFARQEVHLILASLIHHFEWSVPNGEDPMQLDMGEKFGVTLQKEKPLLVVPR
ncbi:(S)-N-methylcoclaurine 3'-hydroxylase isozyme 1-like [Nicotiana tomentosiformis]|uniref:(S)-N-methylcoclaurine 3'-hydroxylase isozyme 1-like n=1 Tax=Nicotiana tomentosiformis TaxID=4098 RepID=UPI00051B6534|nr:(S)-N-methylcoclaurine 3'-hydroxylase isozyme 1-like [Nicotiana tomentosiformis]